MNTRPKPGLNFDLHETLRKEIYKQPNDNDSGATTAPRQPAGQPTTQSFAKPADYGFEDNEFHFDSLYKDPTSNLQNGEMSWSITSLNNANDIQNIVEMRIDSFYFPNLPTLTNKPNPFYTTKVYMQVAGLPSTQAVLGQNLQYHFEFDVSLSNSVAVKLKPTKKSFFFQKPVTNLTTFQVRFMMAHDFRRIPIPSDTLSIVSVAGSNPARFTVVSGDTTSLGFPGTNQTAVYISNFIGSNPTVNVQVNDPAGNFVTAIVDNYTFEIAGLNLTGVDSTSAVMVIPKNRIAFPFRFTSLKNYITNRSSIGHE